MDKIKKLLTWFYLLNKRLFRKPTFLIILIMIPLLVFAYSLSAQGESGMVTILLAQEDDDELAEQVIDDLVGSSQLILFQRVDSAEAAREGVARGKADAAWIFREDMSEKLEEFVRDPDKDHAFVRVVQREEKVMMMLTREILGCSAVEISSRSIYLNFIRENIPEMADATDEELLEIYDGVDLSGDLFEYEQTDGTKIDKDEEAGYLMTPVRGLLATVIVLCGLATAMYYVHDSAIGTFAWLPERRRPLAEFGCQMVSVVDVCIVALITLLAVGQAGGIGEELLVLVLYSVCVAAFSMMMRILCGGIRGLGVMMPLLVVLMLLISPVFFDLGALRKAQFLFPSTYYINAIHNSKYILYMIGYTGVCFAIRFVAGKLLRRA